MGNDLDPASRDITLSNSHDSSSSPMDRYDGICHGIAMKAYPRPACGPRNGATVTSHGKDANVTGC